MRVHRQSTEPAAATALQPLEQALQILQIDEPEAVRDRSLVVREALFWATVF